MMWKLTCLLLIWFYPNMGVAQFGDIGLNIAQQLAPLQNLGAQIQSSVQNSLAPVYALSIRNQMANGVGGVTVATYAGNNPRVFLIQNGIRRQCNGPVEGPRCLGPLQVFSVANAEDLCFASNNAQINDQICLSSGQMNVMSVNGQVSCESSDGSPWLLLTLAQYRNLCGNRLPWEVLYKYYPNPNDPRAIPVPHPNPHVRCLNNQPGVCEFEGDNTIGSGSQGGSFFTSNSGGGFHFNTFSGR